MQSLQLGKQLGKGATAIVYEGICKNNTKKYAIKISVTSEYNGCLVPEDLILRYLQWYSSGEDRGLIKRYGLINIPNQRIGIVLELLGGSLKGRSGPLPGIRSITRQLAGALAFIHEAGVIHADIKPENILLSLDQTRVKLVDFGLAFFKESGYRPDNQIQTLSYRSPEVVLEVEEYTSAVDIWSLAASVAEVYAETVFPVDITEKSSLEQEIELIACHHKRLKTPYLAELVEQGSLAGKDKFEQTSKVSIPIEDSFFRVLDKKALENQHSEEINALFFDLLSKMFAYEPKDRITAEGILEHPFMQVVF